MGHQIIVRFMRGFIVVLACAASFSAFAEDEQYTAVVNMKYPGKLTLTYYYMKAENTAFQPDKAAVNDKMFIVDPAVRPPTVTSICLVEFSEVKEGEEVLDIGTGTGVYSVFAAEKAKRVVATDIEPKAIANAKQNAELNGVADKIEFRTGDLLEPLGIDEKFDVIYFNIAFYFYNGLSQPFELHERFFANIRKHMKPNARIYFHVGYVRNIPYIYDLLKRNGLTIMSMNMLNNTFYRYEPIALMIQE